MNKYKGYLQRISINSILSFLKILTTVGKNAWGRDGLRSRTQGSVLASYLTTKPLQIDLVWMNNLALGCLVQILDHSKHLEKRGLLACNLWSFCTQHLWCCWCLWNLRGLRCCLWLCFLGSSSLSLDLAIRWLLQAMQT